MRFPGKILPSLFLCCCLALPLPGAVAYATEPAIASAGYFGGSGAEQINAIATDTNGNVYLTGWTKSASLSGADVTGTTLSGSRDAFVTKLDAAGNVLFTRYIGKDEPITSFDGKEEGQAIVVDDSSGTVYIAGTLSGTSFNFIQGTSGAYDNCDNGNVDAFIAVIDGNNAVDNYPLTYLSCFGGSAADIATDMVVNGDGSVTIIGYTSSTDFPLTANAFRTTRDPSNPDIFVIRLSPSGNGVGDLLFASYLGGAGIDKASAVTADGQGNLYIVGTTSSSDFSTDGIVGSSDAFIARLNHLPAPASGYAAPQYVHLLPNDDAGINCDSGAAIALDGQNRRLYLTGSFTYRGGFIAGMDADTGQLLHSPAIVGGSLDTNGCPVTNGRSIVLDSDGGGFIAGLTAADDLPAAVNTYRGLTDAFVSRFDADLNPLYTYYLGGGGDDAINALARLDNGFVYLAGSSKSSDLQVTDNSALQGTEDGFLVAMNPQVDLSIDTIPQPPLLIGDVQQFDITLRNTGPDAAVDIAIEITPPADFPGDLARISVTPGDCHLSQSGASVRCLPGGLPPATSLALTVSVASGQQGAWTLAYTLTSAGYEQIPGNNSGEMPLSFVDQLPPVIVVQNGSTEQASGGAGGLSIGVIWLLCLLSLARAWSVRLFARNTMK